MNVKYLRHKLLQHQSHAIDTRRLKSPPINRETEPIIGKNHAVKSIGMSERPSGLNEPEIRQVTFKAIETRTHTMNTPSRSPKGLGQPYPTRFPVRRGSS